MIKALKSLLNFIVEHFFLIQLPAYITIFFAMVTATYWPEYLHAKVVFFLFLIYFLFDQIYKKIKLRKKK